MCNKPSRHTEMCNLPSFPTPFCLPPFPQPPWLKTTHRAGYLARDISFGRAFVDSIPDPAPHSSMLQVFCVYLESTRSNFHPLPGSSLCDMSMEDDLREAIIFDSAKIKGEFWIRCRELVGTRIASWQKSLWGGRGTFCRKDECMSHGLPVLVE
jgi:hypothetical protein